MSSFSGVLYCIHGFLGDPNDWGTVLPSTLQTSNLHLFSAQGSKSLNFESLTRQILASAARSPLPRILVGYSLGGRIALHALLANPTFWTGAVIISAHPGLTHEQERAQRRETDERWAKRFEHDDWDSTLRDWNAQPTLRDSPLLPRKENDFSRASLAAALRQCSLGMQEDLRPQIQKLKLPLLWIVGEKDQKFLNIGMEMNALNSHIQLTILPNASHRAPWDQPELFQHSILNFLSSISIPHER